MDGQPFIVIHSVNTPKAPFPATVQSLFTPLSSVLYYRGKVSDTFRSETWLRVKHPHVNRRLCKKKTDEEYKRRVSALGVGG